MKFKLNTNSTPLFLQVEKALGVVFQVAQLKVLLVGGGPGIVAPPPPLMSTSQGPRSSSTWLATAQHMSLSSTLHL